MGLVSPSQTSVSGEYTAAVGVDTMTWIFRQLFAIAVLPFTVAVIIPVWLARRNAIGPAPGHTLTQVALQACGVAILGLGLLLFSASLRRFITEGRGMPCGR